MTRVHLPPALEARLDEPLARYWTRRLELHGRDSYLDVPMAKFPEDLHVYEQLLWTSRANVVIEIGTEHGGSTLWFRDRLRTMQAYGRIAAAKVIAIDIDPVATRESLAAADPAYADDVEIVDGDVLDPSLPDRVATLLAPDSRCFVVEDSAHVYDTTLAALRGFARFVPVGGFFVVEDGTVDVEDLRFDDDLPRGVLAALHDWLASPDGSAFAQRRELEAYGVTAHPEGFLERVRGETLPASDAGGARSPAEREIAALAEQLREARATTDAWIERATEAEALLEPWMERARTAEEHQASWQARAERAEQFIGELEARLDDLQRRFDEVTSSKSWRVTRPLRDLTARGRGRGPR